MKTLQINKHNLIEGNTITFINKSNYKVVLIVDRITEKSCYTRWPECKNGHRESWNTVNGYIDNYKAEITHSL